MLSKHAFLSATALIASFSNVCFAQSHVQPRWTGSTTTKVKPEMRQEFEGYLKQWMAAYKKAGTPWFHTMETFAGDTTEYTTVVPVMKFGDLDGPCGTLATHREAKQYREANCKGNTQDKGEARRR